MDPSSSLHSKTESLGFHRFGDTKSFGTNREISFQSLHCRNRYAFESQEFRQCSHAFEIKRCENPFAEGSTELRVAMFDVNPLGDRDFPCTKCKEPSDWEAASLQKPSTPLRRLIPTSCRAGLISKMLCKQNTLSQTRSKDLAIILTCIALLRIVLHFSSHLTAD